MTMRERGGGGPGGGGGTAGLGVLLRQSGEADLGLWLEAGGIGITGHGVGQSADAATPANGSHADLANNGGGPGVNRHGHLRLAFPADITDYAGAASNNITVRLFRNNAITSSPAVTWASASGIFLITLGPTTSLTQVATAVAAFSTFTVTTSIIGAADGSDYFALPAGNAQQRDYSASGGHDEIPPRIELLAEPDETPPRILVKYDPTVHTTLQGIYEELAENDQGVQITVPQGTDLTAAPEPVPWDRGVSAFSGLAEAASTGTGGLTRSQVTSLVRGLTKGAALAGGGLWGDTDISGVMARDAEVPGLLQDALTEGATSSAFTDEIPFITAVGEWRKADAEAWRQRLSIDVGDWADTPGFFVFRVGDYTTSNGQLYRVNAENTKDLSNGPETNDAYTLVGLFAGNWTDRYFKEGSITRHGGALWGANADIARGSGAPGSNASWLRLSEDPATVVGVAPKAGSPLTFTLTRADGATYDVTIPGAANSVTDVTIANTNLTIHKRDGSSVVHTFVTGNTTVVANPTGTGGDVLTRLSVDGTDYQVPQATADTYEILWEEGAAVFQGTNIADTMNNHGRQWSHGNGAVGIPNRMPFDVEVVEMSFILIQKIGRPVTPHNTTSGQRIAITAETRVAIEVVDPDETIGTSQSATAPTGTEIADLSVTLPISQKWINVGALVPEADSPITIPAGTLIRPVTTAPQVSTAVSGIDLVGLVGLVLRRAGAAQDVPPPVARPHISSFDLAAGNQNPAAGDIGGDTYAFTYAIAQGSHAGSARIIGFKGDTQPTDSVTVLATLSDLNHGGGTLEIPDNTTLAADEEYRLRLQVFDEGVTNPGAASAAASYQDIVITAHAAATALYHGGHVVYDASDADAAATLARITDFTGDTQTSDELPDRLTINVPDDGNDYQLYFMAQEDATQPSDFTSAGLPATASFYDPQEGTYATVTYNVWILRPGQRVDATDNDDFFGIN